MNNMSLPDPIPDNISDDLTANSMNSPYDPAPLMSLLGPKQIRDLAASIGITPTKTLGQNFVIDPGTVRKIVAIANPQPQSCVMEIGPGLGSLSLALLEADVQLTAVEIDPRLATLLPQTLKKYFPQATPTIITKNALSLVRTDLDANTKLPEYLIANLPYNVSVPVLLHMLAEFPSIDCAVVMVQKEVAERIVAEPGTKIYGVPSVKARYFGTVAMHKTISRTVFWPQPHIDSALISFHRYPQSPWPTSDAFRKKLFSVIDAAFSTRRKTLRQSLAHWAGSSDQAEQKLNAAGISPQLRAEQLTISQFVTLASL